MLRMQGPSFVFHAHDVNPKFYTMWQTVDGKLGHQVTELASRIYGSNATARTAFHTSLKNVILNVHGHDGMMYFGGIGQGASDTDDLDPFSILKGSGIGTIWLISCRVAAGYMGPKFCSRLASLTGSVVVASDESQTVGVMAAVDLKLGCGGRIDPLEGKVMAFHPNGSVRTSSDVSKLVTTLERDFKLFSR